MTAYCLERKNHVNPEKFVAHNEANDWIRGKTPMKNWRAAVRYWEATDFDNAKDNGKADAEPVQYRG